MRWALASLLAAGLTAAAGAQTIPDSLHEGFISFKHRARAAAAPSMCAGETSDPDAKGAWYRKIESVPDEVSVGVRGRLKLPLVTADPRRQMPRREGDPDWWEGPLDRPSVYLGVSAPGIAVDAGLAWERLLNEAGEPAITADGSPAFGFRPFWRVTENGASTFGPASGTPRPSFEPGEGAALSLKIVDDGQMVLSLSGDGGESYSTLVPVPGLQKDAAGRPRSFKRVNAIDQYRWDGTTHKGNEGFDALPTHASALSARWASSALLRADGATRPLAGAACRVAIGAERAASTAPAVRASAPTPEGGEVIDLQPSQ